MFAGLSVASCARGRARIFFDPDFRKGSMVIRAVWMARRMGLAQTRSMVGKCGNFVEREVL